MSELSGCLSVLTANPYWSGLPKVETLLVQLCLLPENDKASSQNPTFTYVSPHDPQHHHEAY